MTVGEDTDVRQQHCQLHQAFKAQPVLSHRILLPDFRLPPTHPVSLPGCQGHQLLTAFMQVLEYLLGLWAHWPI